jgi:hypothetical protein
MDQRRALFRACLKIDGYCLSAAYALRDRERQSRAACPSDLCQAGDRKVDQQAKSGLPSPVGLWTDSYKSSTQLNRAGLLRSAIAAAV